jgi:NAD(P)-dependent dehydrogenase (short-subunit alcohol dehydrogenase family)
MSGSLRKELAPLGITVTAVEPGPFRTDFPGRSLGQSSTVIDDYADTAGRRRKEHDTVHGTQKGDPAKAAQALIAAVESSDPPALLLLGRDALDTFRQIHEAQRAEVDAWQKLTASTDFED